MKSSFHNWMDAIYTQLNVVYALVLRETRTRFGKNQLGYFWAFIEPLAWIGTFLLAFRIGRRTIPNNMDEIGFLLTGLLPFILFRSTISKTMRAIDSNKALLYYPQIRPLDLVLARSILEFFTASLVFTIISLLNSVFLNQFNIENLFLVMSGFLLVSLFATALGLIFCCLISMVNSLEHVISPLLRPMLWISGIFFTAAELPTSAREILIWNPLLQIVEMTRDGWYRSYKSDYYSFAYIIYWILATSFLGLMLERITRRKLEA